MIDYKKRCEFIRSIHNDLSENIVPLPPDHPTKMEEDEICKLVFAPNPLTGFATDPIALRLSRNTERIVCEYLDNFLKALPSKIGCDSDDDAIKLAQPRDLSPDIVNEYYNTILEYANTSDNSE